MPSVTNSGISGPRRIPTRGRPAARLPAPQHARGTRRTGDYSRSPRRTTSAPAARARARSRPGGSPPSTTPTARSSSSCSTLDDRAQRTPARALGPLAGDRQLLGALVRRAGRLSPGLVRPGRALPRHPQPAHIAGRLLRRHRHLLGRLLRAVGPETRSSTASTRRAASTSSTSTATAPPRPR